MKKIVIIILAAFFISVCGSGETESKSTPKGRLKTAHDDLTKHFVFRDKGKIFPVFQKMRQSVKPWKESEKKAFLWRLSVIEKEAPGLIERAVAYRPVQVYRAQSKKGLPAFAVITSHSLIVSDDLLFPLKAKKSSGWADGILAHEITHLAESNNRLSDSPAWVGLVAPRIERALKRFEKGGPSLSKEKRTAIAKEEGLPSLYATTGAGEALADYVARIVTDKGYPVPKKVEAYVRKELLSTPFQPNEADRHFHAALDLYTKKKTDAALREFEKVFKLAPNLGVGYQIRAEVWKNMKEVDKAISDYGKTIEHRSRYNRADPYKDRGQLWKEKGRFKEAAADYSKAIEHGLKTASVYFNRAHARFMLKNFDGAFDDLSESIKINPGNSHAYFIRGGLWLRRKEVDRAMSDYDAAIKVDPKNAPAHFSRGLIWFDKEEFGKAVDDFERALVINPRMKKTVDPWLQKAEEKKKR